MVEPFERDDSEIEPETDDAHVAAAVKDLKSRLEVAYESIVYLERERANTQRQRDRAWALLDALGEVRP